MDNQIIAYLESLEYIQEVNRIVQGMSKTSGKPKEHIDKVWKDTEKEVLTKRKYGVTDKYKEIGNIVRSKMGIKADPEDDSADKDAK